MKKLFLSVALVGLICGSSRADLTLFTSNPPGTPLIMSAGTTSAPMLVSVVSGNPSNDIMAAWNFHLEILPDTGATGTLTFQDPTTTTTPANPPNNYIFGGNGLGIAVTNIGNLLSANEFFDPSIGNGVMVPGMPGQPFADRFPGINQRIGFVRNLRTRGGEQYAMDRQPNSYPVLRQRARRHGHCAYR